MEEKKLTGHYFPYCQFCKYDGKCELRHNEFLGLPTQGKVDDSGYSGHENLGWHFSVFQKNNPRGTCNGRILATGSIFIPLYCECGTAVSSLALNALSGKGMCAKFQKNERGKKRLALAKRIAKRKSIPLSEIDPEDLPELNPRYKATMQR